MTEVLKHDAQIPFQPTNRLVTLFQDIKDRLVRNLLEKRYDLKIEEVQQELFSYLSELGYAPKYPTAIVRHLQKLCAKNKYIHESGLRSSKNGVEYSVLKQLPLHKFTFLNPETRYALEPFSIGMEFTRSDLRHLLHNARSVMEPNFDQKQDFLLSTRNDKVFYEHNGVVYKVPRKDLGFELTRVYCDLLFLVKEYQRKEKNVYDGLHFKPILARGKIENLYEMMPKKQLV